MPTAPVPDVAHALNQKNVERADCGRKIMGKSPGLDGQARDHNSADRNRQAHFFLAHRPGKGQQRECQQRSQIKLPPGLGFLRGAQQEASYVEVFLKLPQFPAIKVAHDLVVINRLWSRRLPKEIWRGGVGGAVDLIRHAKGIAGNCGE
jgi:hypothetical protein